MSSKKGSKKKDPVTANFAFTFLEARETGLKSGRKVHIQYKRGEKKENHGQTDEVDVGKDGNAKFNKSVSFKVTIAPDGDKYESKFLSLSLREVRPTLCSSTPSSSLFAFQPLRSSSSGPTRSRHRTPLCFTFSLFPSSPTPLIFLTIRSTLPTQAKDSLGKIIVDLGALLVTPPQGKQSEAMNKKKPPHLDVRFPVSHTLRAIG